MIDNSRSKGTIVVFITGVDGSGKSTLTEWLEQECNRRSLSVNKVWSRFNNYFSKPLLALLRLTGHNYYRQVDGEPFGFHDLGKLGLLRYLFVVLQILDVRIATRLKILSKLGKSDVLICERGPWDTLVDVMGDIAVEDLGESAFGRAFVSQVQGLGHTLLISRDYNAITAIRQELKEDHKMETKIRLYQRLSSTFDWAVINNSGSLDETKQQILNALSLAQGKTS